jgi:putative LysE/RhtB family amino acid efflux pump
MLLEYLIKGTLIGIIFGIPAGAIGALTIQRTLEHGYFSGLMTGLGSSVADTVYAAICVLASAVVSGFLKRYEMPITVFGGMVILILGIFTLRKKTGKVEDKKPPKAWIYFGSSIAIALMNPGMMLLFWFACSLLKVAGPYTSVQSFGIIVGSFIGTFLWWLLICGLIEKMRSRITDHIYIVLNRILGVILILFGIGVIIEAII